MATYFPTQNGRIKIQAETLLGTSPTNGWVYQPPGTGNNAPAPRAATTTSRARPSTAR